MVDGFGAITWWGFSPALDLQELGRLYDNTSLVLLNHFYSKRGLRTEDKTGTKKALPF